MARTVQWLERRTRDWKVAGSNPCRSDGRIFFSRVDFLCWLLFLYSFHPRVTAVARKSSRSFCQKCRWQVTAKHLTYAALHEVTWCMVVWCPQNLRRDGSSFTWHQPCQRCKYTTSVDIQKRAIKSWSLMKNHMRAQWVLKRAENSAIKAITNKSKIESLQERRENFLLRGRLSVLTLISVFVPPPGYHSST